MKPLYDSLLYIHVYICKISLQEGYRKYTHEEIVDLIDLIQNVALNRAEADRMLRMPERTAQ